MADEMLRVAARGKDGKAKALMAENDGKLNTASDINSTKKIVYNKLDETVIEPSANHEIIIDGDYEELILMLHTNEQTMPLRLVVDHSYPTESSSNNIYQNVFNSEDFETKAIRTAAGNVTYHHQIKVKMVGSRIRLRLFNDSSVSYMVRKIFGFVNTLSGGGGSSVLAAVDKNGEDSFFTVEKDPAGDTALRIVDAAPWAYDKEYDAIKVIEEVKNNHLLYSIGGLSVNNGERITIDDTWDISDFQKIRLTVRTSPDASIELELIYASEHSSWIYNEGKTSEGSFHSEVFDVKSGGIRSIRIMNNGSSPSDITAFEMRGLK